MRARARLVKIILNVAFSLLAQHHFCVERQEEDPITNGCGKYGGILVTRNSLSLIAK
jgi:hypothetical protein